MLVVSLMVLFVLVCASGWLLLFPVRREALTAALMPRCRILLRQRYAWLLAGGALMLVLPPMLALVAVRRVALPAFDYDGRAVNSQVAELLQGEQLVPPPSLPPLAFTTVEVVRARPLLAGANRSWQLFHPDFEQRLLMVFRIMKEQHGYDMALLEGYRSPERQDLLASAGASVTNARAFQSYHQFGLAADCAFLRDGKLVISEKDPWAMRGYRLYGEAAEAAGLSWGGRWTMMDFGHAELRLPGTMQRKR
ncbi:M15 family metallopeptidase [Pseudoduganella aquatica]|uniref:M15 family peptidase n=1 Tax=Pseudoduganella aquatica TaxID=2660641 RepID=A0A7X4HAJ1_9BURK|nr:M15 family metallopeptidase [Pseudoduganella aquatica]MYN07686.1 M15 family peptidase [Pseudoduganella aquatica]